jgi:hypothetical protein
MVSLNSNAKDVTEEEDAIAGDIDKSFFIKIRTSLQDD